MLAISALPTITAPAPPTDAQLREAARISREGGGTAFLVMHEGRVIFEDYPGPIRRDRPHELASGTKSFCGVLALCAQEDGLLQLDEPVSQTISEWRGDRRRAITIRQLLQLTSGIPGGENALAGGTIPTYADAVKIEATFAPDRVFQYGPNPFQAFGELLTRKLKPQGESLQAYLERRILRPLGIDGSWWRKGPDGNPHLPSGARLTAHDWAKFGEMIRLDGRGVLKPGQTATLFVGTPVKPGYGLTWWLPTRGPIGVRRLDERGPFPLSADVFLAAGAGDQRLAVIPERGLTVVRLAPVRAGRKLDDGAFLAALIGTR